MDFDTFCTCSASRKLGDFLCNNLDPLDLQLLHDVPNTLAPQLLQKTRLIQPSSFAGNSQGPRSEVVREREHKEIKYISVRQRDLRKG